MVHRSQPNLVDIGYGSSYTDDDKINVSVSAIIVVHTLEPMRTPQYKASVFQVVTADYVIQTIALSIIVLPIVYFFALIDPNEAHRPQPGGESFFYKAAAILVFLGVIRAMWKWRFVKRIFAQGVEVLGTVTELVPYRYTYLALSYTYGEKQYTKVEHLFLTNRIGPLKIGSQIFVVVRKTNPKQALIRNLYISEDDFHENLPEFEQLGATTKHIQPLVEP